MRVGVLALQGDFGEHLAVFERLGAEAFEVRNAQELEAADALVLPGGESTTMLKLLDRFELRDLLKKKIESGTPAFGTCAGAILLADRVSDGEPPLEVVPIEVERNAYGRQVDSFEAEIEFAGIEGGPIHVAFIRAPIFRAIGDDVRVLASWADRPVALRWERVLLTSFHSEITGEPRVHSYFLDQVCT